MYCKKDSIYSCCTFHCYTYITLYIKCNLSLTFLYLFYPQVTQVHQVLVVIQVLKVTKVGMGSLEHQDKKERWVRGILHEKLVTTLWPCAHPVTNLACTFLLSELLACWINISYLKSQSYGCSKTHHHLSSHLSSAVIVGGTPGIRGNTGPPGESKVYRKILPKAFRSLRKTNIHSFTSTCVFSLLFLKL